MTYDLIDSDKTDKVFGQADASRSKSNSVSLRFYTYSQENDYEFHAINFIRNYLLVKF